MIHCTSFPGFATTSSSKVSKSPNQSIKNKISVDGAFVPLVGKEWAKVKTLAIGRVEEPVLEKGEWVAHTKELSYFSRLADHATFGRLATVETHRRGTDRAGLVCAVVDRAEWEQGFIDLHCPDAVRILDWAHAAEHLAKVGQAVFGVGSRGAAQWLEVQLHELKHGEPEKVLGKLRGLRDELMAQGGRDEAREVVRANLEYLEKRQEQIRYAEFLKAGYPIGSGIVESANKLVVEDRLKGAGMHWARANVNPMVALPTVACSDRWEEAWAQISERLRRRPQERAALRRAKHQPAKVKTVEQGAVGPISAKAQLTDLVSRPQRKEVVAKSADQATIGPRKPAPNHPWRRMPIGRPRHPNALS